MLFDLDPDRFAFLKPFALGAAGSLVSLRYAPGLSHKERAFNLLCGAPLRFSCGGCTRPCR